MATPKLSSSHLITRAVTTRGFLFRSGLPIGASCYPSQFVSGTRVPRQHFGGRGTDHLQSISGFGRAASSSSAQPQTSPRVARPPRNLSRPALHSGVTENLG